jgi:hypothetical protein
MYNTSGTDATDDDQSVNTTNSKGKLHTSKTEQQA